jgi:hypothetical protein
MEVGWSTGAWLPLAGAVMTATGLAVLAGARPERLQAIASRLTKTINVNVSRVREKLCRFIDILLFFLCLEAATVAGYGFCRAGFCQGFCSTSRQYTALPFICVLPVDHETS